MKRVAIGNGMMSPVAAQSVRSILVMQTKFFGDVILSAVLARNLKAGFPDARVVMLCRDSFAPFLVAHGIVDDAVPYRRARLRNAGMRERIAENIWLVRRLRSFRFDLTIDLTDATTTRFLTRAIGARYRVGLFPHEAKLGRFEREAANIAADTAIYAERHFINRYLAPLDALGLKRIESAPSIAPLPAERERASALLDEKGLTPRRFIAVHAGASTEGRRWQPEKFAAAIGMIRQRTGLDVLLVGGPEERAIADAVISASASPIREAVGTISFDTLLAVLAQARIFLGNESGPLHLATAAGIPVVGLYGLTDPIRWGPVGIPNIAVRPSMPCPCIAPDLCLWPVPSKVCCAWRIEVQPVVDAVCELVDATESMPSWRVPDAAVVVRSGEARTPS